MPECNEPCAGLTRLEHQFEDLKSQNTKSHEGIYDRLRELEKSDAVQNERYDTIMDVLGEVKKNTDEIKAKPAKRWEKIVDKIISAAAGALVMYILVRLGLA